MFCQLDNFFGRGELDDAVREDCSEKFHKTIQNTLVMEYFLSKVAELQPEPF